MAEKPAAIMVQGTGSHVGKSLMVAGLCRLYARRGLRVRPFKPQNMSNNAGVTDDGGEIGRAQILQAMAAKTPPVIDMNPVLLKPEAEAGAQVIVRGKRIGSMTAREYTLRKSALLPEVLAAYHRLCADADFIIAEGAGSPAEINLRKGDIANMGFAHAADMPVIMLGDIERGGVIASLIGTNAVLDEKDAARIKGFMVNKFRGDKSLFDDGMKKIAASTGWQNCGIVAWFDAARLLPAEDSVERAAITNKNKKNNARLHIATPHLPRLANDDDLNPLAADPAIQFSLVEPGTPLPLDADIILLPGSKAVMADLAFLREQGWDIDMAAILRRENKPAKIIGLCGGYQMLGKKIHDPNGIEGVAGSMDGLGLLDVETILGEEKTLGNVKGKTADGIHVAGYAIHLGATAGADCARPMLRRDDGRGDGAMRRDGRVMGCYMHGVFAAGAMRAAMVAAHGGGDNPAPQDYDIIVDETLDALADHLERAVDLAAFEKIARL